MKKIMNLSKVFLATVLMAWTLNSCKQEPKHEDTKDAAEDQNEAQLDKVASQDDEATFFVAIAEMDLAEIEMANLAEQKAMHAEVKTYAKMLVADHTKSNAELKKLADNRQLTLPASITDDGKDAYNKLNESTGHDFDVKFVDMMIDDHEKAIKKMEDASEDTDKDESVKVWASNKIAGLTQHLQQAKMLKDKLNKK